MLFKKLSLLFFIFYFVKNISIIVLVLHCGLQFNGLKTVQLLAVFTCTC